MKKWRSIACVAVAAFVVVPFGSPDSVSATEHVTSAWTSVVGPTIVSVPTYLFLTDPTGCAICDSRGEGTPEHQFLSASMPPECDTLEEQQGNENCRKCDSTGFCHLAWAGGDCDVSDHIGQFHPRCAMPEEAAQAAVQADHLLKSHDFSGLAELILTHSAFTWYPERRALQAITPCGRVHYQETLSEKAADALTSYLSR